MPAVAAALWLLGGERPAASRGRNSKPLPAARRLLEGDGGEGRRLARELPLPRQGGSSSLRGTEVDGALSVAGDGHLVRTPDVLRFFDYFFSTTGEVADAEIRRRIEAEIAARLEEPARSEALSLLVKYVAYRDAAAQMYERTGADGSVAERIEAIASLRRDTFGDDAEALFGEDLRHAAVAARMQAVAADPSLDEDERVRRLDELETELPAELREARAAALAPLDLSRDEAALHAAGGSPEEIRALREERFGVEAADRLDELDRRRSEWRARVDDFRRERSAIAADPSLDASERQAAIDELLRDSFSEAERRRVAALDRIELEDNEK